MYQKRTFLFFYRSKSLEVRVSFFLSNKNELNSLLSLNVKEFRKFSIESKMIRLDEDKLSLNLLIDLQIEINVRRIVKHEFYRSTM